MICRALPLGAHAHALDAEGVEHQAGLLPSSPSAPHDMLTSDLDDVEEGNVRSGVRDDLDKPPGRVSSHLSRQNSARDGVIKFRASNSNADGGVKKLADNKVWPSSM